MRDFQAAALARSRFDPSRGPVAPGRRLIDPALLVDPVAPDLHVTLPDGRQATFPGLDWPAMAAEVAHDPQGAPPLVISRVKRAEANRLLVAWEHPLGEDRRPFGYEAFTLDVAGVPVAVAVSGSTVSATVSVRTARRDNDDVIVQTETFARRELVELVRIARHPDHHRALRGLLRLWSEYLAPGWDALPWRSRADRRWRTRAAVSYALPGKEGNLYDFDGWTKVGPCKPWGGSATWSNPSRANELGDGIKTLWIWRYA